jgi:hypothetical protein
MYHRHGFPKPPTNVQYPVHGTDQRSDCGTTIEAECEDAPLTIRPNRGALSKGCLEHNSCVISSEGRYASRAGMYCRSGTELLSLCVVTPDMHDGRGDAHDKCHQHAGTTRHAILPCSKVMQHLYAVRCRHRRVSPVLRALAILPLTFYEGPVSPIVPIARSERDPIQ